MTTIEQRFWSHVEKTDTCWLWTAFCRTNGYGQVSVNGHMRKAHRVAYELAVGPIPEGLDLDHLCRVRRCVNPEHLEPVTRRENLLRGQSVVASRAKQTHCMHGHEFTPENTYRYPRGTRGCRECIREGNKRSRMRRQQPAH